MITPHMLAGILDQISSETTKVAVMLMTVQVPELRADAQWLSDCAEASGITVQGVKNGINELLRVGILRRVGRIGLTSAGDVPPNTPCIQKPTGASGGYQYTVGAGVTDLSEIATTKAVTDNRTPDFADHDAKAAVTAAEWKGLIKDLFDLFTEHQGGRPHWDGKTFAFLKQLVTRHGADEVLRRARIMVHGGPHKFPQPPYDVDTLRFHWNKFGKDRPKPYKGGVIDDESMSGPAYYRREE